MVAEQLDFALPNFRAASDLKERGADLVLDAVDTHGNARLCEAMDDVGTDIVAKVTTVQNWTSTVREDYKDAPHRRDTLWATGASRHYEGTEHDAVREFRDGTKNLGTCSQRQVEGWAAAMWFTDAARACAEAGITHACVDRFMAEGKPYPADGLLSPVRFERLVEPPRDAQDLSAGGPPAGRRGWATQGDMDSEYHDVPQLSYEP